MREDNVSFRKTPLNKRNKYLQCLFVRHSCEHWCHEGKHAPKPVVIDLGKELKHTHSATKRYLIHVTYFSNEWFRCINYYDNNNADCIGRWQQNVQVKKKCVGHTRLHRFNNGCFFAQKSKICNICPQGTISLTVRTLFSDLNKKRRNILLLKRECINSIR